MLYIGNKPFSIHSDVPAAKRNEGRSINRLSYGEEGEEQQSYANEFSDFKRSLRPASLRGRGRKTNEEERERERVESLSYRRLSERGRQCALPP